MKMSPFTKDNFQDLSQLDKIEYLLRKDDVRKNIKKSLPIFEIYAILAVFLYSRLHTLMLIAAFGVESAYPIINLFSAFFNTIVVVLVISFIARIMIYFSKHKQLQELHDEFLDRISIIEINREINVEVNKKSKKK